MKQQKLPYDLNAESAILSAMMIDEHIISDVIEKIGEEMFYRKAHRLIYRSILDLYNNQSKIDIITLTDVLKKSNSLSDVGGQDFLYDLSEIVLSSANTGSHIKIVLKKALLRKTINIARRIEAACFMDEDDAYDIINKAQDEMLSVTNKKEVSFYRISDFAEDMVEYKRKVMSGEIKEDLFYSGITEIDKIVKFKRGKLVIVKADTSVGKSALANAFGFMNALNYGRKVAIFNMEMAKEELVWRELSRTSISLDKIENMGKDNEKELDIIIDEIIKLQDANIYIDDTASQSLSIMNSKAKQMKHKLGGLDIIIMDYLQLMSAVEGDTREQKVANLSRTLKQYSKELDVLIVALSQVNADGKARESRGVEHDADIVLHVMRPLFEDKTVCDIQVNNKIVTVDSENYTLIDISKNRMGKTALKEAWFEGNHQRFVDYENQMRTFSRAITNEDRNKQKKRWK